jgi:hypothetical protein
MTRRNSSRLTSCKEDSMKLKLASVALAAAFGLALAAGNVAPASAKGGHGHGFGRGHHGHGLHLGHFKRHHFATPRGWGHGRKVGWRGGHVPPGWARF